MKHANITPLKLTCLFAVVGLSLAVTGCARPITQRIDVSESELHAEELNQYAAMYDLILEENKRLWRVGSVLNRSAASLCPDRMENRLGIFMRDLDYVPEEYHSVAGRFGIEKRPTVLAFLDDSPVSRSGIQVGDVVLALDDIRFDEDDSKPLAEVSRKKVARAYEDGVVNIRVSRSGVEHNFSARVEQYCDYPVYPYETEEINAFADGNQVVVYRGLIRRLGTSDSELAVVVAHELAHNIMKHREAKTLNVLGGTLVDIALAAAIGSGWGSGPGPFGEMAQHLYSHEFEAEADYVGLYLMAMSGFEFDKAPEFWRRLALEKGLGKGSRTHPSNPERHVAMEKAIEEINAKIEAGEPLVPTLRERSDPQENVPRPANDQ